LGGGNKKWTIHGRSARLRERKRPKKIKNGRVITHNKTPKEKKPGEGIGERIAKIEKSYQGVLSKK